MSASGDSARQRAVDVAPKRIRRFRVTSQTLTRSSIADALDRPNVERYAGIVHDKDPGVTTHAHVVVEMRDARTFETVANMLGVPLTLVRAVVGQKGDLHSFARAVRYLTHESPTEQAKGKHRYADNEVFASEGYAWRAEIDALSVREGHQPPLLDRLMLQILQGDRSALSVLDEFPYMYVRHEAVLHKFESKFLTTHATPEQLELHRAEHQRRAQARLSTAPPAPVTAFDEHEHTAHGTNGAAL